MPDFMSGLAEGIEKSRGMVKAAVNSVAADMVVSPQMAVADSGVMTGTGPVRRRGSDCRYCGGAEGCAR